MMDSAILAKVEQRLFSLRISREARAYERRMALFAQLPRLKELEGELASSRARIMRAAVGEGEDYRPKFEALKAREREIKAEREALLRGAGFAPDVLEPERECAICGDEGYVRGEPCSCLKKLYCEEQLEELAAHLPLGGASFAKFNEGLYPDVFDEKWGASPRENAVAVRDAVRELAAAPTAARSIVISGPTGVGKTYLAACAAREASERAHSVRAVTAAELVALYEREKFTYDDDVKDACAADIARLMRCDLLILDDLGLEFKSPFGVSALLAALASRRAAGKATLVCTTVDEVDLEERYGAELASRLGGDFALLPLFGGDLRRR